MSALRDIKDFVLGKPTTVKVEMPPVAPQATAPPAFLTANLKPDTKEFLVVSGSYNFAVAKSFAQPVVGLTDGWYPEYADMPPFNTAARCEIVISRVPPELTPGATDVQPLLTKAAAQSANLDTNIRVLMSFLRHRWICDRCVLSNAGVFQMAQERFESRHFPTHRNKYLEHFMKMSDVRTPQVAALCASPAPAQPLNPPVLRPARQVCKDQAQWDALPESEKARMIAEEQSQWQHKYAPAWGNSSRYRTDIGIPAPPPSFDEITSGEGWKQPPNQSERETMATDEWK